MDSFSLIPPPTALSIVCPLYNEAESIVPFLEAIDRVGLSSINCDLELIFVDDGSVDESVRLLKQMMVSRQNITVVELSRNFGKEAALSAGLSLAKGEAIIPIDIDQQDPIYLIPEMVSLWLGGADVVIAQRRNRKGDSRIKAGFAWVFYKIFNLTADIKIPENVGDFRLMDRKVVDAFNSLPEHTRFLKGIFSWLGFETVTVKYDRPTRAHGTSCFNLNSLTNLALGGVVGFSLSPLRLWAVIGTLLALGALIFGIYIGFLALKGEVAVDGYASLMMGLTFIGGLNLLGLAIVGEYIGQCLVESKRRPSFIIKKVSKSLGP